MPDRFKKFNPQDCFTPRTDLVVEDIDGEFLILDINNNSYYGLNDLGRLIWSDLVAAKSLHQLATTISDHYKVEPTIIIADLEDFIDQLLRQGLLIPINND